jgi:hypothetical protein
MRIFLCTDDARYEPLWKRITNLEKRNTSAVVGVIAAFLGQIVGAPATLLAGFAVCLYGTAKLGKERRIAVMSVRGRIADPGGHGPTCSSRAWTLTSHGTDSNLRLAGTEFPERVSTPALRPLARVQRVRGMAARCARNSFTPVSSMFRAF